MIARKYASRPDLRDQPILDPDLVLYTNGISQVKQGQWLSEYAVVMEESVVEASSLPLHWFSLWAKLYFLIQALQLAKGKKTNISRLQVCFFIFYLLFYFLISWRLIILQYCSGFCHTLTWISHGFTWVPHPDPPSHLPLHPIPLGLPSAPGPSTCLMHPTWAGDLFHPW